MTPENSPPEALTAPETATETSPQRTTCTGVTKDGGRCKGTVGLVDGMCSIHRGKADPSAAARARAAKQRQAKQDRAEAAERRKMSLAERVALETAEHQDAIIRAWLAPILDGTDATAAHRAASVIMERVLGRPTERLEVENREPVPTLDDLLSRWSQERDNPGTVAVPEPVLSRMDKGIEP